MGHSQLPDSGDLPQSKWCWFGQNLSAPGKRSAEGSEDCEARSNKSVERLIAALPEIWKPGRFVNLGCRKTDEWGKEMEARSWKKDGLWRACRTLERREGYGLPLAVPALPALPTEISEQITEDLWLFKKLWLRKIMELTFWINMLCSWNHLIFASEEKPLRERNRQDYF